MIINSGIITAEDGYTINDTPLSYDSTNSHLIIDSREVSGHLGIRDGYCGSQIWTLDSGIKSYYEEVFFEIKHGLTFIPKVLAYALIRDTPVAGATDIGYYNGGYYQLYLVRPIMSEEVFIRVNGDSVKFIRAAQSNGILTDPLYRFTRQTQLHQLKMRYKYMICSNEESKEEYEIRTGYLPV